MSTVFSPTEAYDTYWRFAAKRQALYERRLTDPVGPWTDDPILQTYRFTNAFRASDRVSQYLIREIQYEPSRPDSPIEIIFRTLLFKIFNKIETWELIERELGPVTWQSINLKALDEVFNRAMARGVTIYSAAYIMPAPPFGKVRKHSNHIALLDQMMRDGFPQKIVQTQSLKEVYDLIAPYPGIGNFLACQYAIDLAYSSAIPHGEDDFVVPGPGALDGISKCFSSTGEMTPTDIIFEMVRRQELEFDRLGLKFNGLFGRRLQPIDCQNLFCEISKYCRVAHPDIPGVAGRTRIKQTYKQLAKPMPQPLFPPKWGLSVPDYRHVPPPPPPDQGSLF